MKMRIVVASDGEPAAMGALRLARALEDRHEATVDVVCAVPPFPMPPRYGGIPALPGLDELDRSALGAARDRIRAQLEEIDPPATTWPITVQMGAPAPTIVRLAGAMGASLIVLGLGRHTLADRWLGTETALRVMRLAHVPVLAVPADASALPTCAVAAVDFTEFSRDAANTALAVLPPEGVLHLAHVVWRPAVEIPWVGGRDWIQMQRERSQAELDELAQQLGGTARVNVQTHCLEGDPTVETVRLARAVGAGLITAGSQGASFFSRALMGSVSTRLVRGATQMVLIAPPRPLPAERAANAQEAITAVSAERLFTGAATVADATGPMAGVHGAAAR
jgi:nucleotide-binding universal stress UspA family protein